MNCILKCFRNPNTHKVAMFHHVCHIRMLYRQFKMDCLTSAWPLPLFLELINKTTQLIKIITKFYYHTYHINHTFL